MQEWNLLGICHLTLSPPSRHKAKKCREPTVGVQLSSCVWTWSATNSIYLAWRCKGSGLAGGPFEKAVDDWTVMRERCGQRTMWENHVFINKRQPNFMKMSSGLSSGIPISRKWIPSKQGHLKCIAGKDFNVLFQGPGSWASASVWSMCSFFHLPGICEWTVLKHLRVCCVLFDREHADSHRRRHSRWRSAPLNT